MFNEFFARIIEKSSKRCALEEALRIIKKYGETEAIDRILYKMRDYESFLDQTPFEYDPVKKEVKVKTII